MKNVFEIWKDTSPDGFTLRLGKSLTTINNVGTVIILHGRTEFIEKYNEVALELNLRGLDVYTMDWRGQGLSDRHLENPQKGHIETFEEYLDDLNWFMKHVVKKSDRPIIVLAHSMGAHIAARGLLGGDIRPKSLILLAPMFGIEFGGPTLIARCIVGFCIRLGLKHRYAFNMGDYRHKQIESSYRKLTSDTTRLKLIKRQIDQNLSLALGGPTYGWIHAAFTSLDNLQKLSKGSSINIPVLVCTPTKDKVVSIKAQEQVCSTLGWRQEFIEGSKHEILFECDTIRQCFWKTFDRFIESI